MKILTNKELISGLNAYAHMKKSWALVVTKFGFKSWLKLYYRRVRLLRIIGNNEENY